ncbi:cell surface protein, partial [Luteimonas aestuarii]
AVADQANATALGAYAQAMGEYAVAVGSESVASGFASTATGSGAEATGVESAAFGAGAVAGEDYATALGANANATGFNGTAVGSYAIASGADSTALGADAEASGEASVAVGRGSIASGFDSVAVGGSGSLATEASGDSSTAIGGGAYAAGSGSTALGNAAQAFADGSVALGQGSVADRSNSISVGSAGSERQITNVAAGTQDTDAVNLAQLNAVSAVADMAVLYDDASRGSITLAGADGTLITNLAAGEVSETSTDAINGGQLFQTNERVTVVEGRVTVVEGRVDDIDDRLGDVEGITANAVVYDDADKGVITLGGVDGTVITNVAAGEVSETSTDAINGSQLFETNQRVTLVEGRVDDLDTRVGDIEGVAANSVQYDDDDRGSVTFAGDDGTQLRNVAAGAVAAGSMDAINGGQMYDAMASAAQIFGGGAAVTAFGTLSAPTYVIQGASFFNVGDALGAIDAQISMIGNRLTSIENNGGVSPRIVVGGEPSGGDDASIADGSNAIAIGSNASAQAGNGVAVGANASVDAANGTAMGANASIAAGATNAVAVGQGATVSASGGTAVGQGASVTGTNGTALGHGASASADNSVALGQGSVANRANTVSVGSAGNERQVTNVAAGTQATDAVNVAQLESTATQAVATANAYTDQRFNAWSDSFGAYQQQLEQRFTDQDRRIDRQGAMGAAMLNMATSAAGIRTQNRVGVGIGFQGGESALSVGYQRAISDRATVTFGGAFSGDEKSVGVGAGFGW